MNNVPKDMRAAAIDRFGGPEELTLHHLPTPALDQNEVMIALDTMGVGPWDADILEGWYPAGRPRFPLVLGVDGAGVVARTPRRGARARQDCPYGSQPNCAFLIVRFAGTPLLRARRLICSYLL